MNHRTGRLTSKDLDPSQNLPAPSWFIGPIEVEPDFAVLKPGSTYREPSRIQGKPPHKDTLGEIAFSICIAVSFAFLLFMWFSH